jgi:hypothetical protein
VDNATRHARSTVTLGLHATDDEAQVLVGNDGPPIEAGDRERIFDRFVRLGDSRARQDGAPVWDCRSRATSWPRTAAASPWRIGRGARFCGSGSRSH